MLRTRLLLTLFSTSFLTAGIVLFNWGFLPGPVQYISASLATIISVAGLTALTLTFFGARIDSDGTLCFNKSNPIHKITFANLEKGSSLCATTWGMVIPVALVAFAILAVLAVGAIIVSLVQQGKVLQTLGVVAGIVCAAVVLFFLVGLLIKIFPEWLKRWFDKAGPVLAGLFFPFFFFGLIPFAIRHDEARRNITLSYGQALGAEFLFILYLVLGIAAAVGLVYGGFRLVPVLASTAFGRFIKAELCFKVKTCPIVGDCTPATPQAA